MTYTVTAVNCDSRVVCATESHERGARKIAKAWRKNPLLRDVKIISRDEYGRGQILEALA